MKTLTFTIYNTRNAAFVDAGVRDEVVRIITNTSEKISNGAYDCSEANMPLRDMNGNVVGHLNGNKESGEVHFSFNYGTPDEAVEYMQQAADKIKDGIDDFILRDTNGNRVGKGTTTFEEPRDDDVMSL